MSPTADLSTYFKRIFGTPGGQKIISDLERQADDRDRTIMARFAAVARIDGAKRAEREDYPKLRAAAEAIDAEVVAARQALRDAEMRRVVAGGKAERLLLQCADDERRGEAELRRTADPRLVDAEETLCTAGANWHHAARVLLKQELRGEFMEAHVVDLNRDDVAGLRTRVDEALARVQALIRTPDPAENEILAALAEAKAASEPILSSVRHYFA
jgi:hypothetical protein